METTLEIKEKKRSNTLLTFEKSSISHLSANDVQSKLALLENIIDFAQKQLLTEKNLTKSYRLSLIDFIEELNNERDSLNDSGIAEFKNTVDIKETDAWRLHKKFQSGQEIKTH